MARRTKIEAAATRETLLDAALRLFRDRGVAHTSLADVATAAGVTRGAVYWHFRDKADLFDALCSRVTLPMEAMLAGTSEVRQADPLGALRTLAVHGLTRLAADPRAQAVYDVVFRKCDLTTETAAVAKRQRSSDSGCRAYVERLLKQAVSRGQLPRATDTGLAAEMMNAFMTGVMQQWVENPHAYDLARSAPAMVDAMLAGLTARPPLLEKASRARTPIAGRSSRRPVAKA